MTDQSFKTIIALTNNLAFYKSKYAWLSRLNNARIKRQKLRLEQLEEKGYEWDY
jgi:hypothetical protein